MLAFLLVTTQLGKEQQNGLVSEPMGLDVRFTLRHTTLVQLLQILTLFLSLFPPPLLREGEGLAYVLLSLALVQLLAVIVSGLRGGCAIPWLVPYRCIPPLAMLTALVPPLAQARVSAITLLVSTGVGAGLCLLVACFMSCWQYSRDRKALREVNILQPLQLLQSKLAGPGGQLLMLGGQAPPESFNSVSPAHLRTELLALEGQLLFHRLEPTFLRGRTAWCEAVDRASTFEVLRDLCSELAQAVHTPFGAEMLLHSLRVWDDEIHRSRGRQDGYHLPREVAMLMVQYTFDGTALHNLLCFESEELVAVVDWERAWSEAQTRMSDATKAHKRQHANDQAQMRQDHAKPEPEYYDGQFDDIADGLISYKLL